MNKEIAVYINDTGEAANLNETGVTKIFLKDEGGWNVIRELPVKFTGTTDRDNIYLDTLNIAEALESCKIFIAKDFSSLACIMLNSMGFSTWKMEGNPKQFLEYVLKKEEEEAEEMKFMKTANFNGKKHSISPVEIGDSGYYVLNLKDLQERNIGVTSKQALKPFLNSENFRELIVACNHIPNWLEVELVKLNLNFEFSETGQNDYILIINRKTNSI